MSELRTGLPNPRLAVTIKKFKHGATFVAHHYIPTVGSPVRVPPRRIPAHCHAQVQKMIEKMLEEGIIEESSSPWMTPAVFVPKKSGELRMCIDYRELNKKPTRTLIDFHLQRRFKVVWQGLQFSLYLTFGVDTGKCQLPSVQAPG